MNEYEFVFITIRKYGIKEHQLRHRFNLVDFPYADFCTCALRELFVSDPSLQGLQMYANNSITYQYTLIHWWVGFIRDSFIFALGLYLLKSNV